MANRAGHLFDWAHKTPDAVALVFDGKETTFAALGDDVRACTGALAGLGISKGAHVGIWLPACPAFITVQQALFMLGATVTPINVLYRPGEVAHAVSCCDLGWIVTTAALGASLGDAAPCPLIAIDLATDTAALRSLPVPTASAKPCPVPATVADDDLVMLLLTSATTGKAKGVMLTAGNLAANYDRTPGWLGLGHDSVILCALPLYNTFGLNQCINAMLVTGCTLVLLDRFDAERCIETIGTHKCTFMPAVPTMLQKIIDHPAASREALHHLRTIMTGGAPVPSTMLLRLLDLAPDVEVLTGYGLTEGTALVTLTQVKLGPDGRIVRDRTIGRVLDGMTLAILDDAGEPLAAGENGEIAISGPNVMQGYYHAPDDTAAALDGRWLRTGDIGYLDADGYAFIVDRKKDIIIRGGQNIYPADIEEVLYEVPGVCEVAVVAQPDEMLGEVPIAFVALRPGVTATVEAMLAHCKASLAGYKCPAHIEIRDELPKGPTGKILRRALRPIPADG
ncbi:class I adenylate-forming enzyme family protein [Novosphingobium colocasiae]|uniref:class I adenylate-forming enzyme family protein n=1 Tax=Novosphingobium colocasiae TaxID=1256513 RepID=UPI0035AFD474